MNTFENILVAAVGVFSFLVSLKGYYEIKYKKNPYGLTLPLFPFTIFVWGDALILGLFWTVVCIAILVLQDWYLFLLTVSLFYVVRGSGETNYWMHEQFAEIKRNNPKKFFGYSLFQNDSILFVRQVYWQCVRVVALIASIYFAFQWLQSLKQN